MKAVVITFFVVLIVTCLINSIGSPYQPYPIGVGVAEPVPSVFGVKRSDGAIPEINYTTQPSHSNRFMTSIDEKSDDRESDFPIGANF